MTEDLKYRTIVADPPWRFANRTGRSAPEYRKKHRYQTMDLETICAMGPQVLETAADGSHLYLWVPTALLNWGLQTMAAWGWDFKTSIYWHKVTGYGISDRSGMGFYYRNVIEPCLFGTRGKVRTLLRNVPNIIHAPKTGHSRKPDAFYSIVERMSPGPYLELFARQERKNWAQWGDQAPAGGVILITTHPGILPTWRDTIGGVVTRRQGIMELPEIYREAETSAKVARAKHLGHRWKNQIRRTLQEHFKPAGYGRWAAA